LLALVTLEIIRKPLINDIMKETYLIIEGNGRTDKGGYTIRPCQRKQYYMQANTRSMAATYCGKANTYISRVW
jgi:hypothetical protein